MLALAVGGSILATAPAVLAQAAPPTTVTLRVTPAGGDEVTAPLLFAQATTPVAATEPAKEPSLASLWSTRPGWDAPEPWRTDRWYFQFAYYTLHFHYDPDHQQSYLFDMEYRLDKHWLDGQWIVGLSLFQNSFGQFSQYLYGGLQWRPWKEHPPFYVKLSAGLLHGYSGEYRDKIPFNHYEIAPAIIPSTGYCWTRYCAEFVLLGGNAALFTFGMTVP
ncbi:MAG: hypothetical protein IT522_11110 [Burkholderiales bacterium]|nr:hypothetical protein [Burkholderiales bacterium]